ncbi:MAG TPA: GNAT family N-acetyltransferase [Bacteriovoracaceae bacterium]|nr:GNAT family N-acetyltransferase [Bacteriovoracaceae bacterium]
MLPQELIIKGYSDGESGDNELQPVLQSELVYLRPVESSDFEDLYAAASDPLIWEQHPSPDRFEIGNFQKYFKDALNSPRALVVIDKKTNLIIGSSRYYEVNTPRTETFIGYSFLARRYWGGAWNLEVKKLMVNHAFRSFQAVLFHIGEQNHRSRRAMEKIGGVKVAQMQKTKSDGTKRTVFIYRITPSDWRFHFGS